MPELSILFKTNLESLHQIAKMLLEKETIDGSIVQEIVNNTSQVT